MLGERESHELSQKVPDTQQRNQPASRSAVDLNEDVISTVTQPEQSGADFPKTSNEERLHTVVGDSVKARPASVDSLSRNYSSSIGLVSTNSIRREEESRRKFWLDNASILATSLALSNIWRLPTFVYFNYSGEALIAYVILMTVVGLPLFIMELALGQFGHSGVVKLWLALPLLKGIGVAQLIAAAYQALYLPSLMTWAFQFGIFGMAGWEVCNPISESNLTACLCVDTRNGSCNNYGIISVQEKCFREHLLQDSNQSMNYKMLAMLAVVMIVITLSISFGEKVMKLLLSISGLLTAALLITSFALALDHPNNHLDGINDTAAYGIRLLTPKEPWGFGRGEVWYGAMIQVLFSLSLGFGTLPSLTSSNPFSRDVIKQGALLWFVNLTFSVVSVLTVFAWVGVSGLYKNDVIKTDAFIYYVYYGVSGSLWAGLAFATIFFSGLCSMLPIVYAIGHNVMDQFPSLVKRYWKFACSGSCILFWALNIPGIIQEGHEVVLMWDHYAAERTVLSCLIIHLVGWQWLYGGKKLKLDFEFMLTRSMSKLWTISWNFVTIALLLIAELWGFFGIPLDGTVECRYPVWLFASGWSFYVLALAVALIFVAWVIARQMDYGVFDKIRCAMKPDRCWGPGDPQLYSEWKSIKNGTASIATYFNRGLSKAWLNNASSAPESNSSTLKPVHDLLDLSLQRLSTVQQRISHTNLNG